MVEGLRIGRGGKNQIIQRKGRENGRHTKERKEKKISWSQVPGRYICQLKIKTKKINKIIREENKERTPGGTKKSFKKN